MTARARLLGSSESCIGIQMATSAAVFQLRDRVINRRVIDFFVSVWFESVSVTACTRWFVCGKFPRYDFVPGRVATGAGHAWVMRPVERRQMRVRHHRTPAGRTVTCVASLRCYKMIIRLAARRHSIVTSNAGSRRDANVTKRRRFPGRRTVAGVARRRGRNMSGGFARRSRSVMAGHTAARHYASVPERHAGRTLYARSTRNRRRTTRYTLHTTNRRIHSAGQSRHHRTGTGA